MNDKKKILVIDDEEIIRQLVADILKNQEYEIVTAATGEEGFQEALQNDYDLLIVDINLPHEDGLSIVGHIKKNDPDAIIIVITGCDTVHNIHEALHLGVFDYIPKPFDVDQLRFAVGRAISAGSLIKTNKKLMKELSEQNRLLEQKVEERTQRLTVAYEHVQEVYLRIITTLVSVIEAKDPYTKSHSENVAKYSVAIARTMNLSIAQIELINKAAKLHDIGKIGIYDSILNKPGKLTSEEFEEVKQHPTKGEEILKPLDFLDVATALIKQHHERFDGKGYPCGLKEEEILIGARIMAVADAYDAMMSGRPYRKTRFTREQAIEEIRRNSGTQFDPRVVDAFLRAVDSF